MAPISRYLNVNCYGILGVEPTCTATELKIAWRAAALEKHPDKNLENPKAKEEMQEINDAYDLLKDSYLRVEYDRINARFLDRVFGRKSHDYNDDKPEPVLRTSSTTKDTTATDNKEKTTQNASSKKAKRGSKKYGKGKKDSDEDPEERPWASGKKYKSWDDDEDESSGEEYDTDEESDEDDIDSHYARVYERGPRAAHYRSAAYHARATRLMAAMKAAAEAEAAESEARREAASHAQFTAAQARKGRKARNTFCSCPKCASGLGLSGSKRRTGSTVAKGSYASQRRAEGN